MTGYFTADASGATFHALPPTRLLDTRTGNGLSGRSKPLRADLPGHRPRRRPDDAVAVTGNLTVTRQTGPGYLSSGPTRQQPDQLDPQRPGRRHPREWADVALSGLGP